MLPYVLKILGSFGHFSTPLGPPVRRLGLRPCRSSRGWRLSPIALHPDCQRAHSPNVSIRHTGSLLRAGGRVLGNSPLFCRFSIPASSSASHSLATGHCSFASCPTSGVRPRADSSPLATAIHRQPNCQRPNGTRSRRAARLCSVCHRNSACYRTRQFLRTNPSVSPRSPPPDRSPFARGQR